MDVGVEVVGVSKEEEITIENGAAVRRPVVVPPWATSMIVEVEVAPETWDQLTDFAITVFDSSGAQIANGPMNYPFHRLTTDLPEPRADSYTATVDLFPAFANPVPPPRVPVRMRVRFEGDPRVAVASAPFRLRAQGTTIMPLPGMPAFDAPPGWQPVVRVHFGGKHDAFVTTQTIVLQGGR